MHPRTVFTIAALTTLAPGCSLLQGGDVGSHAKSFLTGADALIVELDVAPGAEPNNEALTTFTSTLQQVTGRSVTVERGVLQGEGPSHAYTFSELRSLASGSAAARAAGADVMHAMYLDGTITDQGQSDILGLSFDGTNIAMAKGKIRDVSCASGEEVLGRCINGQPKETFVERAVLVHEAGHLLGLVNVGTSMVRDHEDAGHPGHSRFETSVMYWAVEQGAALTNLIGGGAQIPHQFDEYDREDLREARGG
ncbi:MAG: hypothetical protein ACRDH5_06540 [bacterium]